MMPARNRAMAGGHALDQAPSNGGLVPKVARWGIDLCLLCDASGYYRSRAVCLGRDAGAAGAEHTDRDPVAPKGMAFNDIQTSDRYRC